jgi:hypothetical protein
VATVSKIAPENLAIDVPNDLKLLPGWLIWRYETQEGNPKPLKVPYYVSGARRSGAQGAPADRAKLTTFPIAREIAAKRGFDGVGLAMLADWGITALDFDNCVGLDGALPPEIMDIVGETYSEYSPSGNGVRAFVRGSLGNSKAPTTPTDYGFETFSSSGFVTFTGQTTPYCEVLGLEDTISEPPAVLQTLCERRFTQRSAPAAGLSEDDRFWNDATPALGLTVEGMEALLAKLDPSMGREDWIRVGMALHHETQGDDTGFELWDEWSAGGYTYPGTEGLRTQWDSFTRREGSGRAPVTMASVIKMAKDASPPTPSSEDLSRAATEAAKAAEPYAGRFPVVSAGDLSRRKPVDWLIKGVLPRADLVVLFGASGSGKSFVGIDLMAAIARGTPWRERRVKKGRAVIIAAEGGGGMGKRIEAYCQHHDINADDLDMGIITAPPNFMNGDDITDLVRAISASGGADVIMVDTFAQVTPGANENAGEDMGRALANARALRDATGAVVVLVHHAGKDASKGSRGWSGIKAAADAEIEVVRDEDSPVREIRVSKMKDGDDGLRWAFRLEVLDVGTDGDGDVITSCVAVEADLPPPSAKGKDKPGRKLGRIETHIAELLESVVDPLAQDIDLDEAIRLCVEGMPKPEPGKRDVRRQHVDRALRSLCKGDEPLLAIKHGRVIFLSSS